MSLYDFFFSKGANAERPASDPERIREYAAGNLGAQNQQLLKRVARLEHDVGALALVVASILKRLDEKGQVTRDEVKETIQKLDLLDKVRDGRINVEDLGAGSFFDAP
ncbi:MAG: hypothetical protein ACJ754_13575 [Pyrinomonadaceae bacterium]